jgi:hypothetical protein
VSEINNQFSCRAASPDNSFDIQGIIQLFKAVYGETFPIRSVYDQQYWRQHIGARFTSILVFRGKRLVGHLAAQPEGSDGKMVQIMYPLCDPEALNHLDQISETAWNIFQTTAKRQAWQGIYFFALSHAPEMIRFAEVILGAKPIAICPAYFPPINIGGSSSKSSERANIIISQKIFNPESDKQRSIYVTKEHADLTRKLYHGLRLPRDIRSEAKKDKLASYPLPADRVAIESRYFAHSGIMHAYIEPSLLVNDSELSATLLSPHAESTFVFVKAYDPRALEVSKWLEASGYDFSGVLPFIHDRESLLFSKTSSESILELFDAESVLLSGATNG